MSPAEREERILRRIQDVMRYAYEHSGFYRRRWDDAGIHPASVRSLEDFEKVPVVTKKDLREDQEKHPPFGDYLCIPESEVFRVHGSSGTTGRPTAFAIGRRDWSAIAESHARVMWGMGIRPGDMVFIASFFSLYMGAWGALLGSERLGCKSLPFGAGAPGQTARAVSWLNEIKPQIFYSTPSYALHIGEVARESGYDPRDFGIQKMFFSGEPGASIPAIRDRIQDIYGAKVFDSGTMAEMSPWMSAACSIQSQGMLLWQDMVYTEVCDPVSHARVDYGREGTPVYSHLERTSQPMIRMLSGDLTRWVDGPSPCGRTYPRLPDGIYGRIDDMFIVRGHNVYPSAIHEALVGVDKYGGEHRIIISRRSAMDELAVQAECTPDTFAKGDAAIEVFKNEAGAAIQDKIGIRATVEVVPPGTFPPTEFKARRVVDDRNLFQTIVSWK